MHGTLTIFIVVSSLIVVHMQISVADDYDFGSCSKLLTEESELEWSTEQNDFRPLYSPPAESRQTSPHNFRFSDTLPPYLTAGGTGHEKSSWLDKAYSKSVCIQAPVDHYILIQISLKAGALENVDSRTNPSSPDSCLSISEFDSYAVDTVHTLHPVSDLSENETGFVDFLPVIRNETKQLNNSTTLNHTSSHIERFPRHSHIITVNQHSGDEISRQIRPDVRAEISGKSRRRCKKCRKGTNRRRRNRHRKRKVKLFKLLLKYGRLLIQEEFKKSSRKVDELTDVFLKPSGISEREEVRPTRSSTLKEVLNKINRFVESDTDGTPDRMTKPQIRRQDPYSGSAGGSLSVEIKSRRRLNNRTHGMSKAEYERNKRDALKNRTRSRSNATDSLVHIIHETSLPFSLCGLEFRLNASNSSETFSDSTQSEGNPQNIMSFRSSLYNNAVDVGEKAADENHSDIWISMDDAFKARSTGQTMKLDVQHGVGWDDTLLQFILVKIAFISNLDDIKEKSFSDVQEQMPSDVTNTLFTTEIVNLTAKTDDNSDQVQMSFNHEEKFNSPSSGGNGDVTIAIVTAAALFVVFILFIGICLCRRSRLRQRRRQANMPKSPQEDRLIYTSQTNPVYRSNMGKFSQCNRHSENAKKSPPSQHTKKKRMSSNHQTTPDGVQSREDEIGMLKYGCGKKNKLSHVKVERICKEDLAIHRMHMQKSTSAQKCGHFHIGMGMSQHRHCIVCQIAEKPHQPIVGAQYVSDFLPPASQNTGLNSPNTHNSFDKFNRMQNNPYRQSPNLSTRRMNLPSTISLPDGEELYKTNCSGMPNSSVKRLHPPEFVLKDGNEIMACNQRKVNSIKSPPNRTVFDSDDLPFVTGNQYRKTQRPNGYPGPPSGPGICNGELCRMGGVKRGHHHHTSTLGHKERDQINFIHCLGRDDLVCSDDGNKANDKCICKYILNHIKEPPPDYSDVVRDDMLSSTDQQYNVTRFGNDVIESPGEDVSCDDQDALRQNTPFLNHSHRADTTPDISHESTKNQKRQ